MGTKIKNLVQRVSTEGMVNPDTGEYVPKNKVFMYESMGKVEYRYDRPLIINKEAVEYIKLLLEPKDFIKVLTLLPLVESEWNILCKGGTPHTPDTLSEELDMHKTHLYAFIKRLLKRGVFYYIHGYKNGKEVKYIMVNPNLARSQRAITDKSLSIFDPLGTDTRKSLPLSNNFE
jgi:predicted transcriptional regulator